MTAEDVLLEYLPGSRLTAKDHRIIAMATEIARLRLALADAQQCARYESDLAAQALAELARLRADLARLNAIGSEEIERAVAARGQLVQEWVRDELAMVRAGGSVDAARLDWIEEHAVYIAIRNSVAATIGTSREAIDVARGAP